MEPRRVKCPTCGFELPVVSKKLLAVYCPICVKKYGKSEKSRILLKE